MAFAKLLKCLETVIWIPAFGKPTITCPLGAYTIWSLLLISLLLLLLFLFILQYWWPVLNFLANGTRLKIAEFIVILMSQILPSSNRGFGLGEGPKPAWMTKWAQQELIEVLGKECSAVVDDIIDAGRQTYLDKDGQQTAMLRYAQELLQLASWFQAWNHPLKWIITSNLYFIDSVAQHMYISDTNVEVGYFQKSVSCFKTHFRPTIYIWISYFWRQANSCRSGKDLNVITKVYIILKLITSIVLIKVLFKDHRFFEKQL